MQRTFSKEFKFKVAMEAIKGDLTIADIHVEKDRK